MKKIRTSFYNEMFENRSKTSFSNRIYDKTSFNFENNYEEKSNN